MRIFADIKKQIVKLYAFIKELEQIPLRNFSGDFDYDKKDDTPRAKRTNQVKVEDLRPSRND